MPVQHVYLVDPHRFVPHIAPTHTLFRITADSSIEPWLLPRLNTLLDKTGLYLDLSAKQYIF